MSLRVYVRGTSAVACAVLLGSTLLAPAQATQQAATHSLYPAQPALSAVAVLKQATALKPALPLSPADPTDEDIEAAKKSAAAKKAEAEKIDQLIFQSTATLQRSVETSMSANTAYTDAMLLAEQREAEAKTAKAKAEAAAKQLVDAKAKVGTLAGTLYKSGGVGMSLQAFVTSSDADDTIYQASTLQALTDNRAQIINDAKSAADSTNSLKKAAAATQSAADQAAAKAESNRVAAQASTDAQAAVVKENEKKRAKLLSQLAQLNGTTAALESARVQAIETKKQQEALQAQIDASANTPVPAPPSTNTGTGTVAANPGTNNPPATAPRPTAPAATRPPAVTPPAVTPPVVRPPVVTPPVVRPPVTQPPVVTPPVTKPPVTKPPVTTPPVTPPSGFNTQVMVNFAMSKLGSPYVWGGTGPGYDCSGLVYKAFAAAGKNVARTGTPQFWNAPVRVPISQMQYGDLLVWNNDGAGNFSHVGIYIGNGQVLHALNPSTGVTITPLAWMSTMRLYPFAARY